MVTNDNAQAVQSAVVQSGPTSGPEVHEKAGYRQGKVLSMPLSQNMPNRPKMANPGRGLRSISTPETGPAHGRGRDTVGTVCRRQSRKLCGNEPEIFRA